MDTLQVIALIIVALIILAVVIAFRKRIALTLKGWGFDFTVEAENPEAPKTEATKDVTPSPPAGVSVAEAESSEGGLLIEEGRSETGPGIDVKRVKTKDDIIIGKGESGGPKDSPPA